MHLVQIELRADDHTDRLVESREYGQALLVLMPVVADNWLRGNFLRVDQLEGSRNALLDAIPVFDAARFGVGVLVEVHRTVPAARGKNIAVLREEVGAPHRRLRNLIPPPCVPFGRMVSPQIVGDDLGLEGRDPELVHCEVPNATVQQSAGFSPSIGSSDNTGSCWRGSHTRTVPSRDPVTSSGAPKPTFRPPMPSIALMILSCALSILKIGSPWALSRSQIARPPL